MLAIKLLIAVGFFLIIWIGFRKLIFPILINLFKQTVDDNFKHDTKIQDIIETDVKRRSDKK